MSIEIQNLSKTLFRGTSREPKALTDVSLPSKHAATNMRLPQAWLLRSVPDEENRNATAHRT